MSQIQNPLDPEFGKGGVVTLPFPDIVGSSPTALLEMQDEKLIVILGTTESQNSPSKMVRLNTDGSLDQTFGDKGVVELSTPGVWFSPRFLHLGDDDKFLTFGTAISGSEQVELAIVRQLKNGDMDKSFGTDGLKLIDVVSLIGASASAQLMIRRHNDKRADSFAELGGGFNYFVQEDGRILLCCTVLFGFDDLAGLVFRLNSDGSPDLSFHGLGFVQIELPGIERLWNYALAVVAQGDGSVVVSGDFVRHDSNEAPEAYIICYHQNGQINPQFGNNNNGLVVITRTGYWLSLASMRLMPSVNSDKGIIAIGSAGDDGMVVVLTSKGAFNLVFNNGKTLYTRLLEQGEKWLRAGIQTDSGGNSTKIILAGRGSGDFVDEKTSILTARFQFSGVLDTTFGENGFNEFINPQGINRFLDGAVLGNNNIVASGSVRVATPPVQGYVLRYLGEPL